MYPVNLEYFVSVQTMRIKGLYITTDGIFEMDGLFDYSPENLYSLLDLHRHHIKRRLIDDHFLDLNVLDVLEVNNKVYPVQEVKARVTA